jgi:hypothetical protein
MRKDTTFFHFQLRALQALLGWGVGSVLVGIALLPWRAPTLRFFGIQMIGWGAIDAALAIAGRRGAQARIDQGADNAPEQTRRFRLIVLVNALLDVGYILGGLALIRRARGRPSWAGSGAGIAVQGAFLLLFDSILAWLTGRWTGE